ncbi:MAG TPA: DNA primase [Myxococcota bacterium]|nr:DNA primase [Myxococcota bacterium]HRY95617.1 DNA primase [Myxococcota bacterium]HSA20125.1 DNA primase [Myxococcota bacterium]
MSSNRRDDVVETVRSRIDMLELVGRFLKLKKVGSRYVGLCPFHSEKTPSFHVNPQRGFYHCFGCQESGDAFSFLMRMEGKTFPEALEELAARAGVELPARRRVTPGVRELKARLLELNEQASAYYEAQLWSGEPGRVGREYLQERKLPEAVARRFHLGFAPPGWDNLGAHLRRLGASADDALAAGLVVQGPHGTYDAFRFRLVFPILGLDGKVCGFGARKLDPEDRGGKYINSSQGPVFDKGELLYGLEQARGAIQKSGRAVLVEGYFDALGLVAAGIENSVAGCGTALTEGHARLLRRFCDRVVTVYDGDAAGQKASLRSAEVLLGADVAPYAVELPEGHDPDTFVLAHGQAEAQRLIDEARPTVEVAALRALSQAGDDIEARTRGLRGLLPMLQACQDGVRRAGYLRWLAERFRVGEADLKAALAAARERRPAPPLAAPPGPRPLAGDEEGPPPRHELDAALRLLQTPEAARALDVRRALDDFQSLSLREALSSFVDDLARGEVLSQVDFLKLLPEPTRLALAERLVKAPELTPEEALEELRELLRRIRATWLRVEEGRLLECIRAAEQRGAQDEMRQLQSLKKQVADEFAALGVAIKGAR